MASDREITIVIRAEDEFSDVMEKACVSADSAAGRIRRGFDGMTFAGGASGLGEYAAGLQRVVELESTRLSIEEKASARRELDRLQKDSPYNKPATFGEDQETVRIAQGYQSRLNALQSYNTQVMQEMIKAGASRAELEAAYAGLSVQQDKKKFDFQVRAAGQAMGVMANFMQNLYVATGSNNKALFEMMKAFSIARAMISGAEATVSAYAWGAYFGGPPLGAAFAAVAAAATAAQIAQIASMNPGGAGASISASGYANPGYYGGSPSAYPVPQSLQPESMPAQNVTVNVYNPLSDQNWQKVVEDNIIPAINNASDRNVTLNVRYA